MGVLEELIKVSPFIHQLTPFAQLVITDKEKYLIAIPGDNFFLKVFSDGQPFLDGSIGKQTVTTGKNVTRIGNKALTGGTPYQGTGVPVIENNEVVGSMCIFFPTSNLEMLQETSETMVGMVEELTASLESFQEANQFLHKTTDSLTQEGAAIQGYTTSIESMASLIADVSRQTQLLGLNASIEAAHAGEAGKGFAVVASEIRKLSQHTSASVKQISDSLAAMTKAIDLIGTNIQSVSGIVNDEIDVVQSLNEAVQQVQGVGDQLHELARVMRF